MDYQVFALAWLLRMLSPARRHKSFVVAAAFILAAGIFVADTLTDLEIAASVLYVTVILMASTFCQHRGVIIIGIASVVLTLLSYFLTSAGDPVAGSINALISIIAIVSTTVLVIQIQSAQIAAREAQARLTHISRVTTLGELTASLAHEINQPLAASVANASACLRWLNANPPNFDEVQKAVQRIVRDNSRAGEIITKLRNLVKRTAQQEDRLDLNEVVMETIDLADREMRNQRIAIESQFFEHLPPIKGDRVQLQQVLLNLILNAGDAISTNQDSSARQIFINTVFDLLDKSAIVEVSDTGKGLEGSDFERIFEPFYTTKNNGMGMGLAIARSIIEAHGGRIWAKPKKEAGATFLVSLPTIGLDEDGRA